jgi:hypothetical protein
MRAARSCHAHGVLRAIKPLSGLGRALDRGRKARKGPLLAAFSRSAVPFEAVRLSKTPPFVSAVSNSALRLSRSIYSCAREQFASLAIRMVLGDTVRISGALFCAAAGLGCKAPGARAQRQRSEGQPARSAEPRWRARGETGCPLPIGSCLGVSVTPLGETVGTVSPPFHYCLGTVSPVSFGRK